MNAAVDKEINDNQGDAGESFVRGLLQRRGFTVNVSEKDRFGWDLNAEHIDSGAIDHKSFFSPKLIFSIQVKSTRVVDKETCQIKLSALKKLIESPTVCVIAFVKFAAGDDLPSTIRFVHVGKSVIVLATKAIEQARRERVALSKRWVTIDSGGSLEVDFNRSRDVQIYEAFVEFKKEFPRHYAQEKEAFCDEISIEVSRPEVFTKMVGIRDCEFVSFESVVGLSMREYQVSIGPSVYREMHSPFLTIIDPDARCECRWNFDVLAPLSDVWRAFAVYKVVRQFGWHLRTPSMKSALNKAALPVKFNPTFESIIALLKLKLDTFYGGADPELNPYVVHDELLGEEAFDAIIVNGGIFKVPRDVSGEGHAITHSITLDKFEILVPWTFRGTSTEPLKKGAIVEVGPGQVESIAIAEIGELKKYFKGGEPFEISEVVYLNERARQRPS